MRVKKHVVVSLTITTFDDNTEWVHVDVVRHGMPSRTVFQSKAVSQLSHEDLEGALASLDQTSHTCVNRFRHYQPVLF